MSGTHVNLFAWQRCVRALPAMCPWIRRAVALETCDSTQDECHALSAGQPGVLVTAVSQTQGRGRLGRSWAATGHHGLAVTISLDASRHSSTAVSLAGGVAACRAVQTWIVGPAADRVGLKWPNDVVGIDPRTGASVKIAGVLVESRGGALLLGVGINVGQREEDFPEGLRGRAASIMGLSEPVEPVSRLDVLGTLMMELDRLLFKESESTLDEAWKQHDVLVGTTQTFEHAGGRVRGVVRRIEPSREIILDRAGETITLPAMTTTLVKPEASIATDSPK
jgi:BirA family transcriptional regulator, biotin operon repressor / biotin---[acetyl-CoA-carboxylase] ligase